jgi:archaellum component FlaG (FlaF/FlaG flagellin family)
MNKIVLILVTGIIFSSCDVRRKDKVVDGTATAAEMAAQNTTTVEIIDSVYNFGSITEGEKVTYNFRFKNSGKNPLVVTNTTASCGCTVPDKPEKPILPGETAFIKVVFNSTGKVGHNNKTITVSANAEPAFPPLYLKGEVTEVK